MPGTSIRRNNKRIGRFVFAMRNPGVADAADERNGHWPEMCETRRWARRSLRSGKCIKGAECG